jgi:hypothetical protein
MVTGLKISPSEKPCLGNQGFPILAAYLPCPTSGEEEERGRASFGQNGKTLLLYAALDNYVLILASKPCRRQRVELLQGLIYISQQFSFFFSYSWHFAPGKHEVETA